jgi:plasmid stabilization system protein ParE
LIQNAEKMLVDEAFDPTQHPRTASALNRLYEEGTRPGVHGFTPEGSEVIRRHLMNAEDAAIGDIKNPAVSASADSRLAAKLLDDFDDFIDQQLSQAGPQYRNARSLWSAQLKSAEIERLFERAQNQAGQYSVSGMDNALRTQFKSLADNPRRFRRFNEQERQAILKVVRGDLPQNWSQRLGKFAVTRGGVSTLPAMAGFSIDPMLGGILAIAGEGARAGSTLLRTSRARAVDELIRSGAIPSMPPSGIRTVTQPGVLPTYGPANALAVDQAANQLRDERARRNALAR